MKLKLLLVLQFVCFQPYSQNPIPVPFIPYEANTSIQGYELGDGVGRHCKLPDGTYIYTLYFLDSTFSDFPINLNFFEDVLEGNAFQIVQRDRFFNILRIQKSKEWLQHLEGEFNPPRVFREGNTLHFLGTGTNVDFSPDSLVYYHIKSDLSLLIDTIDWFYFPEQRFFKTSRIILNDKGNFVTHGGNYVADSTGAQSKKKYVIEFKPNGEVINRNYFDFDFNIINSIAIEEFQDGGYLIGKDIVVDSPLNLVEEINSVTLPSGNTVQYNDKILILGTNVNLNSQFEPFDNEYIVSVSLSGEVDTLYHKEYLPPNRDMNPTSAVALQGNKYLYFATMRDAWSFVTPSNVVLSKVDLQTSVLEWSVSFGGDHNYIPREVLVMEDGGCTLISNRYSINGNKIFLDVVAARFDRDGNPIGLTKLSDPTKLERWSVFPNPTDGSLNFECENDTVKELRLELNDEMGRVVFSGFLKEGNPIDISNLPNGVYFYSLQNEQRIVGSGKLLKN